MLASRLIELLQEQIEAGNDFEVADEDGTELIDVAENDGVIELIFKI